MICKSEMAKLSRMECSFILALVKIVSLLGTVSSDSGKLPLVTKPDCSSSSGSGVGGGGSGTSVPDLGGQQSVISSILRAPPITTRGGAAGQVSGKVMPQRPQQPQPPQETNRSGLYLNLFEL